MERKSWNRRHFLYGMFSGTCLGVVLATALFTVTQDQVYVMLIPLGFAIGIGVGAARSLIDNGRTKDNNGDTDHISDE
ncbi:MAG TPA: hypothetical protein VMW26_03775 [Methanomassiliicoccales archaeon]|nr:hypothetical protein [Methanomassiliicoccales archaeon]